MDAKATGALIAALCVDGNGKNSLCVYDRDKVFRFCWARTCGRWTKEPGPRWMLLSM